MGIDQIIAGVLDREGGYVNDAKDTGGETNFGLTIATARSQGYMGKMRDMPRAFAIEVYRRQYLVAPGFNKIAALDPAIAGELVDTGVNMGTTVAGKFLQRCLNVLNNGGRDYADLLVDGDCGAKTRGALAAFLTKRGKAGSTVLLRALNCLQGAHYIELAESRAQNEAFEYGWLYQRVT